MTHAQLSVQAAFAVVATLLPTLLLAQEAPLTLAPAQGSTLPTELAHPMKSPVLWGPVAPDGTPSGLWAAGSNYKVSFHDGMTFYPQVGATLPHQPVSWRTTSAFAGSQDLLAHPPTLAPKAADFRCEYDLGGITERYDVRDEGLEQSFVVPERPAAGDLVIAGTIDTPLVLPSTPASHGALSLALENGREIVVYGAATAIDARGRHTAVTTATEGNRIVLRMAAADVAEAEFPLLIDPLFATSTTLAFGASMKEVDVLHETTSHPGQSDLWYVWTNEFAAGDHDLRLWRSGADWTTGVVEQYREITNWDARHGRLALAAGNQCVVLVHSLDSGSNRFLLAHRHYIVNNFLVTSATVIPQPLTGTSRSRPDVGGRLEPAGSKVLITYQEEAVSPYVNTDTSTIYATVLDTAIPNLLNGFVVPSFVLLARTNADQERPVVTQASDGNQWLVAFQELNNQIVNDAWDITTVAVDATGAVTQTNLDTEQAGNPLLHKIDPEIAGAFGRYVLTYTTRTFSLPDPKPSSDLGHEVFAQRIDWNHGTGTGSKPWPAVSLHALTGNGAANEGLAFDSIGRSHWCAGLQLPVSNRYRVFKLGFTGEPSETASLQLPGTSATGALATTFSSDPRRFPIVYTDNAAGPTSASVQGTFLQYVALALPTVVGVSCGSGVWAGLQTIAERQQIGSQTLPLRLTNAPNDTLAILAFSTAQANIPGNLIGLDGCTVVPDLGAPNFLGFVVAPIVGGEVSLTLDLPPALQPFSLVLQWGYFVTPPTNPLGIQLSEGLVIDIDY